MDVGKALDSYSIILVMEFCKALFAVISLAYAYVIYF
jgi:hypothetical protein